jgi:hypothetical protein
VRVRVMSALPLCIRRREALIMPLTGKIATAGTLA